MSTKVTPETLKQLEDIHTRWNRLTKYSGELRYQLRILEKEIAATDAQLDQLDNEKLALDATIEEQFGSTGSVDLATGEFIPDKR